MLLTPGDQLENWRIQNLLGEGGMGSVYRGQSMMLEDVHAAIKVTRPTDFQHARERFLREIKALLKLHHPAVVRVQGFGEDQDRGLLWFAMDLVDGQPLDEANERGAMPMDRALHFFTLLAEGLAHAHERGVAHRDIKPANIIVRSDGTPVLVDFGISTATGDNQLTKTGGVIGTPQYLPPEALDGRLDDPMVGDIYALGQVLLETVTGRPAFPFDPQLTSTQNALRIMHNKVQVGPLDPGQGVPDDLRGIVLRATHPEPSARTATAAEVAEQLRSVAAGVGIQWGGPTLLPVTGETHTGGAAATMAATMAAPGAMGTLRTPTTMEVDPTAPSRRAKKKRKGGLLLGGAALVAVLALLGVGVVAAAGGAIWWMSTQDGRSAQAQPAPDPLTAGPDGDIVDDGRPDPVGADPLVAQPGGDATAAVSGAASAPASTPAGQTASTAPAPGPAPSPTARPGGTTTAPNPLLVGGDADLGPPDGDIVDEPGPASVAIIDVGPPDGDIVDEPGPSDDGVAVVADPLAAAAPAVKRMRPDWSSMAGVRKGTSDGELDRAFGASTSTSSPYCKATETARSYLDGGIIVCRRIGLGGARRVQVTRKALSHRSKLPSDPKLALLGMTEAELAQAIGDPAGRDGSGRWRYEYNTVIIDFAGGTVRSVVVTL